MLWGTPQRGNWWQVVLVSMRLCSVKSRTFDLLDEAITMPINALVTAGLLGSYREDVGWGKGRTSAAGKEMSAYYFPPLRSAG